MEIVEQLFGVGIAVGGIFGEAFENHCLKPVGVVFSICLAWIGGLKSLAAQGFDRWWNASFVLLIQHCLVAETGSLREHKRHTSGKGFVHKYAKTVYVALLVHLQCVGVF